MTKTKQRFVVIRVTAETRLRLKIAAAKKGKHIWQIAEEMSR